MRSNGVNKWMEMMRKEWTLDVCKIKRCVQNGTIRSSDHSDQQNCVETMNAEWGRIDRINWSCVSHAKIKQLGPTGDTMDDRAIIKRCIQCWKKKVVMNPSKNEIIWIDNFYLPTVLFIYISSLPLLKKKSMTASL